MFHNIDSVYCSEIRRTPYPALTDTFASRIFEARYCDPPLITPRTTSIATCCPALRAKDMLVPETGPDTGGSLLERRAFRRIGDMESGLPVRIVGRKSDRNDAAPVFDRGDDDRQALPVDPPCGIEHRVFRHLRFAGHQGLEQPQFQPRISVYGLILGDAGPNGVRRQGVRSAYRGVESGITRRGVLCGGSGILRRTGQRRYDPTRGTPHFRDRNPIASCRRHFRPRLFGRLEILRSQSVLPFDQLHRIGAGKALGGLLRGQLSAQPFELPLQLFGTRRRSRIAVKRFDLPGHLAMGVLRTVDTARRQRRRYS